MIECPFCHANHVDNTIFCHECGTYLLDEERQETDPLVVAAFTSNIGSTDEDIRTMVAAAGTGPLTIRLSIERGMRYLEMPLGKPIHLGRLDPASDTFPEIDLTDVGGVAKGVSRRHARILKRDGMVIVEDLGSINGTFINSQKLAPYQAERVDNGDVLHLGQLIIEIKL